MKKPEAEKRPVGRPKKEMEVVLLPTKVETPVKSSSKSSRSRGTYMNWFVPSLWDPIFATVSKHRNLRSALRYLQLKYRRLGETMSVYDKLTPSTLREWFTSTGELKAGTKQSIFKETAAYTGGAQHAYILANHPELEEDIITLLKSHRDAEQPLYASSAQGIIRGLIRMRNPNLLDYNNKTGFRVGLHWTRDFLRTNLNWSLRKATGAARKLPSDWELKGLQMAQRAAYLVRAHSITPEMMVNTDQTGIHLAPTGGSRTWAEKGTKHVLVHGMEDKQTDYSRSILCSSR